MTMKLTRTCLAPHAHKCPKCDTIWAHDPDTIGCRNDEAHDCPQCGAEQGFVYFGDDTPTLIWDGYEKRPFE